MKKKLFSLTILAMALLATSCSGNRNTASSIASNILDVPEMISNSPHVAGFSPYTFLLNTEADESLYKVEVFAGKEMEIDCNIHNLLGDFEERTLEDGHTYLFFNSNGQTVSTRMACLDNTMRKEFVTGKSKFLPYNSNAPIVVYHPEGIDIRHRIWKAGETYPITPALAAIYNSATRALEAYPTEKEGYMRHVLLLSDLPEEQRALRQVEIIPGKVADVDCNRQILGGTFTTEIVEGWGYDYLVFSSDGIMARTRMACPDPAKPEFVSGPTEMLRYNPDVPIVVFAPVGFEVRYRIWEVK